MKKLSFIMMSSFLSLMTATTFVHASEEVKEEKKEEIKKTKLKVCFEKKKMTLDQYTLHTYDWDEKNSFSNLTLFERFELSISGSMHNKTEINKQQNHTLICTKNNGAQFSFEQKRNESFSNDDYEFTQSVMNDLNGLMDKKYYNITLKPTNINLNLLRTPEYNAEFIYKKFVENQKN